MPSLTLSTALQLIVGLGLLNVWLRLSSHTTPFRGGTASSLREEFAVYGLPGGFFYLIGSLKIASACLLLAGIWVPSLVLPAATLVAALMVGAIAMHIRVRDAGLKSVPALLMLAMSVSLCVLAAS